MTDEGPIDSPQPEAETWSRPEVDLIVADYLEMLRLELRGVPFNKAEHRRRLSPKLSGRSKGSIEFKHANISAVMDELDLPYISGYKPRGNFQRLLREAVEDFLREHPGHLSDLA